MYAWDGFFTEEKLIIDAKSQDANDEDSTEQNEEEEFITNTSKEDIETTFDWIKENLVEEISNVSDMENPTNDDSEIDFEMNEPEEQ